MMAEMNACLDRYIPHCIINDNFSGIYYITIIGLLIYPGISPVSLLLQNDLCSSPAR